MKASVELFETEAAIALLGACREYKEACQSASAAMIMAMQEALDDGLERAEIYEICVVRGQLSPSTVRGLMSKAATQGGHRARKSSNRLSKDAAAFMKYVLGYRNGHIPSKKELRSWCLAVSRQLRK